MSRALPVALLALCLLQAGCRPSPTPRTVGEHSLALSTPSGWTAYDEGRQLALRQSRFSIMLRDLGVCSPAGWRNEVASARALSRSDYAAARQRLGAVGIPEGVFATPEAAATFRELVEEVAGPPVAPPSDQMEAGYAAMLALLADVRAPDLDRIVTAALPTLGYDPRGEDVKSRTPMRVGGLDALDVATWNRFSHATPRRYVFVCNDGYLLALDNDRNPDAETDEVFAKLLATLRFVPRGDAYTPRR